MDLILILMYGYLPTFRPLVYHADFPSLQINYTEKLLFDYRHFDAAASRRGISPRFEFGFGLSYTMFAYYSLQISG